MFGWRARGQKIDKGKVERKRGGKAFPPSRPNLLSFPLRPRPPPFLYFVLPSYDLTRSLPPESLEQATPKMPLIIPVTWNLNIPPLVHW